MATITFNELSRSEVAINFYAAISALVDTGRFETMEVAAERIGIPIFKLNLYQYGQAYVSPSKLRRLSKIYGINPGFIHFGIGDPLVPLIDTYKISRAYTS